MKKPTMLALALLLSCQAVSAQADVFSDLPKKDSASLRAVYKGKMTSETNELDRLAIQNEDPAVRTFAFGRMTRNFSSDTPELKFYTEQLAKEQNPKALAAGLRSLMNNLSVSADVYELFKKSAAHPDANVRRAAMSGLVNKNNSAAAGIEAEGVKFLDDKDPKICQEACKELARAGNAAAMTRIEALIGSKDASQAKLLGGCAEGLVMLWYNYPFFNAFDAKAYRLTLDYLKIAPRSNDMPSWLAVAALNKKPKSEWQTLAKGSYKAADVAAVLADIARDKKANRLARQNAIEALAIHGTKADLEALANELAGDPVAKNIEKAMQQAK